MTSAAEKEQVEAAVRQAFYNVMDPELGVNVMDLGLIVGLDFDQGELSVRYRLTSPTCPVGGMMSNAMDDAALGVPGVGATLMTRLDDPPWSADCISPEGRKLLGI